MKRLVAVFAAVVALVYGVADKAAATVLYTETQTIADMGSGYELVFENIFLNHEGPVRFTFTSNAVINSGYAVFLLQGGTEHIVCTASSCTPDGTGWGFSGWDPCYGGFICYGSSIPADFVGKSSFATTFLLQAEPTGLLIPAGTWPEGTVMDDGAMWNAGVGVDFSFDPRSSGMTYTLTIATVPEPATWATMIIGLFGLGALLRRRRALQASPA